MNKKLQIQTLFLYVIFIFSLIQISSCKKIEPASVAIVTPPPTPTPPPPPIPSTFKSVFFWTSNNVYDTIFIKINNETHFLDESWGGNGAPPDCCYYCGTVEFKMLPGVYEWKTWRKGRDTARGALTVTSNCLMQQISY